MLKALVASVAIFLFVGCEAAHGQTLLEATVPFQFHVGKQVMPAGNYIIEQTPAGFVTLKTEDRSAAVVVVSYGVSNRERAGEGMLVFNRYEDRYFFSELWHPHQRIGRGVTPTGYEREVAQAAGTTQIASIPMTGDR